MKLEYSVKAVKITALCASVALSALSSTVRVKGNLSTSNGPVSFALVSFARTDDTLTKFTALSDTLGNFQLDVVTGIGYDSPKPNKFQLDQNYPNPFSSRTAIPYMLKRQSSAYVRIYSILGAVVKEFNVGTQSPGIHGITWDGTNNSGNRVAAGIYFCRLTAAGESQTRKMVLGGGGSTLTGPRFGSLDLEENKGSALQNSVGSTESFVVLIQCSDTTSPPIVAERIANVVIQSDTSINFNVQELDDFAFCYNRGLNGRGQIFVNNVKGTHPRDISNYTGGDDGYPQWSPDGKHIVFQRGVSIFGPLIMAYDIFNQTYTNLTADGGESASPPQWTPNGKVVFAYERPVLAPEATYMMNPDGSGIRQILDSVATNIYFYPDSYRFLYIMEWTRVYKTNIDGTTNDFICDLQQLMNQGEVAQGFNPSTDELLIAYISLQDSLERIAGCNVATKSIRDICVAGSGYVFNQLKFSDDCTEIAAVEHSAQDEWLSIIKNGTKKRFVQIPESDPIVRFSYEPMTFSSDGQKLAYSVLYFNSGSVTWKQKLYVLDLLTGIAHFIDLGWNPSWRHGY